MIPDQARTLVRRMSVIWPRVPMTPEEVVMWTDTIHKFRVQDVEAALETLRLTEDWMPSHAKLVAAIYAAGKRRMAAVVPDKPALPPAQRKRRDPAPPKQQMARLRNVIANPGEGHSESRNWWDCPVCVEAHGPDLANEAWAEARREREANDVPRVCARCDGNGWKTVEVESGAEAVVRCDCYRPRELHEPKCSCVLCHYGPRRADAIAAGRDGLGDRDGPDPLKVKED